MNDKRVFMKLFMLTSFLLLSLPVLASDVLCYGYDNGKELELVSIPYEDNVGATYQGESENYLFSVEYDKSDNTALPSIEGKVGKLTVIGSYLNKVPEIDDLVEPILRLRTNGSNAAITCRKK